VADRIEPYDLEAAERIEIPPCVFDAIFDLSENPTYGKA
jgi:hypothetical protein